MLPYALTLFLAEEKSRFELARAFVVNDDFNVFASVGTPSLYSALLADRFEVCAITHLHRCLRALYSRSHQQDLRLYTCKLLPSADSSQSERLTMTSSLSVTLRPAKPRVRCTSFGCSKDYGRRSEMLRHKKGKHANKIEYRRFDTTMKEYQGVRQHRQARSNTSYMPGAVAILTCTYRRDLRSKG